MSKPTFVDLFAGCGGLSLGLMQAGWTGLFAVEKDPRAFRTLEANLIAGSRGPRFNWPDWLPQSPCEIGDFNKLYWQRLKDLRGNLDLVAGGPPCQGFSFAGRRNQGDPRNRLFERFVTVVKMTRPRYILLENVTGIDIALGKKAHEANGRLGRPPKSFADRICEQLGDDLNYSVFAGEVRADECGVAQWRPRFFLIGIRHDLMSDSSMIDPFEIFDLVRPDFLRGKGINPSRRIGVKEALSDLETRGRELIPYPHPPRGYKQIRYEGPETAYQKLLHGDLNGTPPNSLRLANHRDRTVARFRKIIATCRPGVSLSAADKKRLGGIKKHTLVLLDPHSPSHTITSLPDDIVHYSEPRILTVREMARLQSFPDWWEFRGKYTTGGKARRSEAPRYTQVANAVAPFVAELFGETLLTLDLMLNESL